MLIVSRLMVFLQIQFISVSIWFEYAYTLRFKLVMVMFKHRIMYVQPACYALLYFMCMYANISGKYK